MEITGRSAAQHQQHPGVRAKLELSGGKFHHSKLGQHKQLADVTLHWAFEHFDAFDHFDNKPLPLSDHNIVNYSRNLDHVQQPLIHLRVLILL